MNCPNCGQENADFTPVCIHCNAILPISIKPQELKDPPNVTAEPPVKKKKRPVFFIAIALLLVVTIVAGLLTNWFGFYGPITKIGLAAKKTLLAESFTACVDISLSRFSVKKLILKVQLDIESEELTVLATDQNSIIQFAIYEGKYLERTGPGRYTATDIQDKLDRFFLQQKDKKDVDWDNLIQTLSPELYEKLEGKIDYDALPKSLLKLYRRSNRPSWLKNTANYTMDRLDGATIYTFIPDENTFLPSCMECFQDAFPDSEVYEDFLHQVQQAEIPEIKLECTVKNRHMTQCTLTLPIRGKNLTVDIKFSKIGSTGINRSELAECLSHAKPA